jgi:hypothetical protein
MSHCTVHIRVQVLHAGEQRGISPGWSVLDAFISGSASYAPHPDRAVGRFISVRRIGRFCMFHKRIVHCISSCVHVALQTVALPLGSRSARRSRVRALLELVTSPCRMRHGRAHRRGARWFNSSPSGLRGSRRARSRREGRPHGTAAERAGVQRARVRGAAMNEPRRAFSVAV